MGVVGHALDLTLKYFPRLLTGLKLCLIRVRQCFGRARVASLGLKPIEPQLIVLYPKLIIADRFRYADFLGVPSHLFRFNPVLSVLLDAEAVLLTHPLSGQLS